MQGHCKTMQNIEKLCIYHIQFFLENKTISLRACLKTTIINHDDH